MASASTTTVATTTTECLASANDILAAHAALIARVKSSQAARRRHLQSLPSPPHELVRLPLIPTPSQSRSPSPPSTPDLPPQKPREIRPDLPPAKRARLARYRNYVPEEETIRNDYSQRYVDGGEWPQNWVIGAEPERRFEEYPKQQRLLTLKKASVNEHSLPSSYLPYSSFSSLTTPSPAKFDVILIDPPFSSSFTWDNLQELPIPALAADPSFVFLWVGSGAGEGLERGRETLAKWGYRRAEDIVWVKTNNKSNKGPGTDPPTTSLLTRTKQHCLMGIRGTVRRSTDSWFVHCNVDTDVIIWEGDPSDPTLKPPEMYTLIENFCLGIRRLEIFGHARASLRRGWVTVLTEGEEEKMEPEADGGVKQWDREAWETRLKEMGSGGKYVVPMTPGESPCGTGASFC
ncbi:MT-A70-domain-containing protein [Gloeophyllum trabeum ATCC 11539]|uniref:MT-A70-domain-containing protein n=1 Tax=Gloeophyllum trabeum (strain ATCC 11539 / FP-39264 / Madison 617) TaxID=670483 RepID=S7Q6U4_GLOTA|nr:MT-A70-domain-containing protein [Gloeophyllum trabeum ATCC 11539]EPQ55761.1 MT-A70-domain-containing protein [Gloeophyllum trabeum ATCC 11539]